MRIVEINHFGLNWWLRWRDGFIHNVRGGISSTWRNPYKLIILIWV